MRKIFALLLVMLTFVFTFTGCDMFAESIEYTKLTRSLKKEVGNYGITFPESAVFISGSKTQGLDPSLAISFKVFESEFVEVASDDWEFTKTLETNENIHTYDNIEINMKFRMDKPRYERIGTNPIFCGTMHYSEVQENGYVYIYCYLINL